MNRQTSVYETLGFWGSVLQDHCRTCGNAYLVSVLSAHDLTTAAGVKELADHAIADLTNNSSLTVESAKLLWQASQCLKKFRYGCQVTPAEMQAKWVERNAGVTTTIPANVCWLLDRVRELLAPLGPIFDTIEADGRFGNGAVEEGWSPIARWNHTPDFPYNICDPDDARLWTSSSRMSARLCCVPKDMFKLRSITVEPAEATFLQQRTRLRLLNAAQVLPNHSAIPQQLYGCGPEVQRRRALEGSLTGALATIDLSDASDSIPWAYVSRVFPANIVAELERARSTYVSVGETQHELRMYAGMGNATTFIVESLYFWAVCTVLSRYLGISVPVSVFGDDIVLSTDAARHPLFTHYLTCLGHKVNMVKSGISRGPGFREACGLVAYNGVELPLLRIQGWDPGKPEELVSMCSWTNCALALECRYAPFVYRSAVDVGRRLVEEFNLPILPEMPSREGCYLVDAAEQVGGWSYRSRWNSNWQVPEVRVRCVARLVNARRVRHLTLGESQGVLRGQLRTAFADAPLGYANSWTTLRQPARDCRLTPQWVSVPSSDASLLELSSGR